MIKVIIRTICLPVQTISRYIRKKKFERMTMWHALKLPRNHKQISYKKMAKS